MKDIYSFRSNATLVAFITYVVIISGCINNLKYSDTDNKIKELEQQIKLIETQKKLDSLKKVGKKDQDSTPFKNDSIGGRQVDEKRNTKYIYVIVYAEEPEVKSITMPEDRTFANDVLGLPSLLKEDKYITYSSYKYTSKIFTIENYSDDKKYMKIDEVKDQLRREWSLSPIFDSEYGVLNRRIKNAQAKVFDNYSAASISKSKD